ncbi:aminopeptidase P N-terminal domain-containing protein [Candidatus Saccharibacteria bacterium]|nr:aminopeptidase P N-terminal domain-containing protein [Candidatus Saccharibacteria bacterium]
MKTTFYKTNRIEFINALPEGSWSAIASHDQLQGRGDVAFPFWQEPNFYYLTGLPDEPGAVLYLGKKKDGSPQAILVVTPRSKFTAQWSGQDSLQDLQRKSGIEHVISSGDAVHTYSQILETYDTLYITAPKPEDEMVENPALRRLAYRLRRDKPTLLLKSASSIFKKNRSIKKPEEIQTIQKAADISTKAFLALPKQIQSLDSERQVAQFFDYQCILHGGEQPAYTTIVASGANGATIHHTGSFSMSNNQLVLVDAATQFGQYAADITRTIPRGKPSKRQKEVFEAVLSIQTDIIKHFTTENSLQDIEKITEELMREALKNLGLKTDGDNLRKYYPHAVSHHLGLEVHDVGGRSDKLQPNMVVTVEPGIYIPEEEIGVRIEDMIRITEKRPEILTANLPSRLGWD